MKQVPETYRTCRRHLAVPAIHALRYAREHAKLMARIAETGFEWKEDRHYHRYASWQEAGFDLDARIFVEGDGWWTYGVGDIGRFVTKRQPGTIRHRNAGRNECQWFLPANPENGHEDYRRACSYGEKWWYVGVEVTASRAGIALGGAELWGIDYEPGVDGCLTETAFELASEAISNATSKLQNLCGCH